MRVWPGSPYPRGATWDGFGVNVAVYSAHASNVELCLFDHADATVERERIPLPEQTDQVWHGYFPDLRPGQLYGFRVSGAFDPGRGHRFNPQKLLFDPYGKAIGRDLRWHPSVHGYPLGDRSPDRDLTCDTSDSGAYAPLAMVVDNTFDWGHDRPPRTSWTRTILYELHVKGFTKQLTGVPEPLRGTYAGLASAASIDYLLDLGVTAIELLPVHHHLDEGFLVEQGRRNYWGYNTLGYFAPNQRYAAGADAVGEFKQMVKTLHEHGLEVILDVVYNHTAEGNQLGPTVCFRGLDNSAYYRVADINPRYYVDFTGCGNSLNMRNPHVLQLVMDSLRYWVTEMHVDGFRFDLACTLARELNDVDRGSAFFDVVQQDPTLAGVKLIAEPWDIGPGGYQVGNFPPGWTEWNGRYRDNVRRFWKGDCGTLSEFAARLAGSSDLYGHSGRRPYASINFITCHDGFTLHDLVSYNGKHNDANGEQNRDGNNDNMSWNCGTEGETSDAAVNALRARQKRNFLATLLFSQGVPMLLAGDELGQTQHGNNNGYCQDNELSWLDWRLSPAEEDLLDFVKRLIRIRREQPVFRRRGFFHGRPIHGSDIKDIYWLTPNGGQMTDADWNSGFAQCLGVFLVGGIPEVDDRGERVEGDNLLLILNAWHEEVPFTFRPAWTDAHMTLLVDTARPERENEVISIDQPYPLAGRSLALFRWSLLPTG